MTKLGDGKKFKKLEKALAAKGAKNPAALAASIGRKKYGALRFGQLAAKGRKNAEARKQSLRRVKL